MRCRHAAVRSWRGIAETTRLLDDSIRQQQRFDSAASCDRLKRTTNPIENSTHRQAFPLLLYGAAAPRSAGSYVDVAAARRLRLISISIISVNTTLFLDDPQTPSTTTTATTAAAAVAAAAIPLEHGRVRRSAAQPPPIITVPRCLLQQGPMGRPAPHRGQARALPIVSRRPGEGEPVLSI